MLEEDAIEGILAALRTDPSDGEHLSAVASGVANI
jgi:hypothetical protein